MERSEEKSVYRELASPCFPGEFTPGNAQISSINGGLTNRSYLICRGEDKFVFRLAGENTLDLGIDRKREKMAAERASRAGINAPLAGFSLPRGHMLTRWVEGKEWTRDEFGEDSAISRSASLLARVHKLEPVTGFFDPYRDIAERARLCRDRGLTLPGNTDKLMEHLDRVRENRKQGPLGQQVFCHNDPYFNNFFVAGNKTLLLDWEFAGTGDALFDLVSATQVLDCRGNERFLEVYGREAGLGKDENAELAVQLESYRFVVMFWNALWALIQAYHGHIDHDFSQMAANIFLAMEKYL